MKKILASLLSVVFISAAFPVVAATIVAPVQAVSSEPEAAITQIRHRHSMRGFHTNRGRHLGWNRGRHRGWSGEHHPGRNPMYRNHY